MTDIRIEGDMLVYDASETTRVTHRRVAGIGIRDTILTVGPFEIAHSSLARERIMQKLLREWVTAGWGDDCAEMLAAELAKLPGAPEPFPANLGGYYPPVGP